MTVTGQTVGPSSARVIHLAAPPCTIGITDGSERGDYVPQQHLLRQFGRPHHVVNLMFQYYPDMAGWPTQGVKWHGFYRNNELNRGDGYFPLVLEEGGTWGQAYLRQIADVRAHGQEPQLTLTLHCDTPTDTLIAIARSLAPYAPMRIRINHECNGTWFYFNQRWSYREVSDCFVRFHDILHEHAPGVKTVACWNGPGDAPVDGDGPTRGTLAEDQLGPMFRAADIVSFDQYASLHYGWPEPGFDPAHPARSFRVSFERWWDLLEDAHARLAKVRGGRTDLEIHEINEDADLVGDEGQAEWTTRFYGEAVKRRLPWLTNITFYQFRDRGGLGLEREDVNDPAAFRVLPALKAYCAAVADPHFAWRSEPGQDLPDPSGAAFRWASTVDARGGEWRFRLPEGATARHIEWPADSHLLVGCNGLWEIKPHGQTKTVVSCLGNSLAVSAFAPPSDGRNNLSGAYHASISAAPILHLA